MSIPPPGECLLIVFIWLWLMIRSESSREQNRVLRTKTVSNPPPEPSEIVKQMFKTMQKGKTMIIPTNKEHRKHIWKMHGCMTCMSLYATCYTHSDRQKDRKTVICQKSGQHLSNISNIRQTSVKHLANTEQSVKHLSPICDTCVRDMSDNMSKIWQHKLTKHVK